ncbi:beta-eliminating lyase [Colletotrichum sublineola]|nr:beta-eliminating lyase [Colletotrichum sublineola]
MARLIPPSHNALVVRPHIPITAEEREEVLRSIEYTVFAFPAALLTCDFLSDSGTSAMTDVQWAAMLRGDESYGRNSGYYCLLEAFRDIFERGEDRKYVFRDVLAGTADSTLYRQTFLKEVAVAPSLARQLSSAMGFFDTTGAKAAATGFQLHTFTQPGLTDPFPVEPVGRSSPFKGNLDIEKTSAFLSRDGNAARSAMLLLTITNNWAGAQPVSMANIKAASALAQTHDIPLFFDACRFAENAKFIQDFEDGCGNKTIPQIVQEMFSQVDGFTISLKKDGLANMGGALCFRDEGVFSRKFGADVGIRLKERQIMCYGNDSYGGMSGRDVMAAAVGLYEVTKESYLADRINQVKRFAEGLIEEGCARSYGEFASIGFTLELLKDYGIRACEAGPFGWEWDKKGAIAQDRDSIPNLVRFAVHRYVMSDRHIEYTVAAISALHKRRQNIPGVRITRGKELRMRVFQSGLEPVPVKTSTNLHAALKLDREVWELLQAALDVSMQGWGNWTVSECPNGWRSDASLSLCPFEYSVAIERDTGKPQLRFMVEAQADAATLEAHQKSALHLTADIQSGYSQIVSLDRFNVVKDLFFPPAQAEGTFAAWHSFAADNDRRPEWKIYLTPNVRGKSNATGVVREALERLEMPQAWTHLDKVLLRGGRLMYLSLDLSPSSQARVKVYVQYDNVGAAELAEAAALVAPETATAPEIQKFCSTMSGGSEGPYKGKGPMTCFGFTASGHGHGVTTESTVYFPVHDYATNDAEIRLRLEKYLRDTGSGESGIQTLRTYQRGIDAAANRPLRDGQGIHAWVGLKMTKNRGSVITFYLASEVLTHCL